MNDIKEKTGSIKFVNTKRNRAKLNEQARKRRPVHQVSNDYDDPEPRTTARSTNNKKNDPAPRPTRRPIPKLEFTTQPANIEDPEPATTAKGILNQAIAHNKKRIKAQILKQKKEITRSGIVPPPRTFLLNRKKTEEANEANLDEKKEFKIIDAEELFDRLVEKNAPTTTTTTTTTSTTIAPTTTTTEHVEYSDGDSALDYENIEEDVAQVIITTLSSVSSEATTLKPILEKEPVVPGQVEYEDNEEGSGDASPITTSRNTIEPNTHQNPSNEADKSSIQPETSTLNTVTLPPSDSTPEVLEKVPSPVPLTQNKSPQIDASKSLGQILAELPKEKLEKFKQYLLTLSKEDKKLVSKMLQSNLEAARKSVTTTTASPYTSSDAVIDLGILGTFRLEKPKTNDEQLSNNQIKT